MQRLLCMGDGGRAEIRRTDRSREMYMGWMDVQRGWILPLRKHTGRRAEMVDLVIAFIAGMFAGGLIVMVSMACLVMAADEDKEDK